MGVKRGWTLSCALVAIMQGPLAAQAVDLSVLVQNMQFILLAGGDSDSQIDRATRYGDLLADDPGAPDVIGFTETFLEEPSGVLLNKLVPSHPHQLTNVPVDLPGTTFINSGLSLVSKFPIVKSEFRAYTDCSGFDCLSAKGVLAALIKLPRAYAVVSVCHQNSGAPDDVLLGQLATSKALLSDFVAASVPASAVNFTGVISMGDYNIDSVDGLYSEMLSLLSADAVDPHALLNAGADGFTYPVPIPTRRIDYIFNLRAIDADNKCAFPNAKAISHSVDVLVNTTTQLSDHFGVAATFSIADKPGTDALPEVPTRDSSCNPAAYPKTQSNAGADLLLAAPTLLVGVWASLQCSLAAC